MNDPSPTPESAVSPGEGEEATLPVRQAGPTLEYDYFKSMVSVSVATLGGILTLGEAVFGARISPWQMGVPSPLPSSPHQRSFVGPC